MTWQADLALVEKLVDAELARLRKKKLPHLSEVVVRVAWVCHDDPDRYGEFVGVPVNERPESGELPPECVVFARPLVHDFGRDKELQKEVRITVLHELGHALGMEEDDLQKIGLE